MSEWEHQRTAFYVCKGLHWLLSSISSFFPLTLDCRVLVDEQSLILSCSKSCFQWCSFSSPPPCSVSILYFPFPPFLSSSWKTPFSHTPYIHHYWNQNRCCLVWDGPAAPMWWIHTIIFSPFTGYWAKCRNQLGIFHDGTIINDIIKHYCTTVKHLEVGSSMIMAFT